MPEKKPVDYTNSAENLCNPEEIGTKLVELSYLKGKQRQAEQILADMTTYKELQETLKLISDTIAQIKDMVDAQGSYQNLEEQLYAVKYRRISKSYRAQPFIENYPKYAPAVIVQSIDVKILDSLLKGGLLNIEDLKDKGVVEEIVSFAYYVR